MRDFSRIYIILKITVSQDRFQVLEFFLLSIVWPKEPEKFITETRVPPIYIF